MPSAWVLSSRPLSNPLPLSKEGLVTFTRRTSAQAVPVCVRVLIAPPTLYLKSRCRLNTPAGGPPGGDLDDKDRHPRLQTGKMSSHIDIFDEDRAKAKKFQMEFSLVWMTNPNHQNMRVPMQWVALALSYST